MASPFITNTRIPSVQGSQNIQNTPQLPAPQNNIFLYGNQLTTAAMNGVPILQPQVGFPLYQFYKTYQLPSQYSNDPFGMLSYFQNCGFNVGYGYSNTISLLNASAVDITSQASSDNVIVYYLHSSSLIAPLVGAQISGTFDDTTATVTGTFVSAAVGSFTYSSVVYDSYIVLQSTSFASVAAADTISVSFSNSSVLTPDPTKTDPFLMNLYQALQASLIPLNVNSTVATPAVYFALLPQSSQSGYFGATSSPITLSIPTAETATSITLAIPSLNINLIPLSALGATTITQATSDAVGTVVSSIINGGSLVVTLSNVTGTFDTSHTCTLHLDSTQTIFSFQQAYFANNNLSLAQIPCIYPIESNTSINTTYAAIFSYVASLNLPATSQNGQSVCQVILGNIDIAQNLATTTLASATNNYQFEPVYYPYVPIIGELPLTVGQLTSAYAMVVGSNVAPLNPQGGVIVNGLPVPTDNNKWINTQIGGIADQVMKLGWNVIAINNNSQAYVINPLTGQTTLPNTSIPDVEFFYEYVWQTVDYLRKGVTVICQAIGLGQVRQTPVVLSTLKAQIISFMLDMQTQGMLLNVVQNESFVTIVQDPNNPLGIDIGIPTQIVPGLEQIYYTINIFSSTVTLQTTA